MKKFLHLFLILTSAILLTSCEEEVDGKQRPIKLDRSELTFASTGGAQTATAVNYKSWWISGAYEDKQYVNGTLEYINYVYPTSTDGEEHYTNDILDGGWYYVVVPEKGDSNQVVITVNENKTAQPRSATIIMQNRNAFTNISIHQE